MSEEPDINPYEVCAICRHRRAAPHKTCCDVCLPPDEGEIIARAEVAALEWQIASLETINGHMLTACKWALAALCSHGPCKNNNCSDCAMARKKLREIIG